MKQVLTRRDFLKKTTTGMAGLALLPWLPKPWEDQGAGFLTDDLGRVAIHSISVYQRPDDKSKIICQRFRDEILNVYYEEVSESGPGYNPRWLRVWRGYVHTAYIQRVRYQLNPLQEKFPEKGALAQVTVPHTQVFRRLYGGEWVPYYRLYYGSNHWIMGVDEGPDGKPWYRLKDELLKVEYHAPAAHFRVIKAEEITPLSPNVPPGDKRIEVSIARQTLTAYEGDRVVLKTKVSTGLFDRSPETKPIPTDTPLGTFRVQSKVPSKHMGDGNLTDDITAYELPGVPWVSFFEPKTGVAFHGTYWHDNFGLPMSHGCVNMRTEEALWIYRWTTPTATIDDWAQVGYGTVVEVT